ATRGHLPRTARRLQPRTSPMRHGARDAHFDTTRRAQALAAGAGYSPRRDRLGTPATRGGADVERHVLPHLRTRAVRWDRLGSGPLAGHIVAGRGGDRGWYGAVALRDLVPVRY